MTTKSKLVIGAILVLLLFIGGVVTGYYRWGLNGDEPPDYKGLLKDTVKYIASLEHQNSELEKQLQSGGTGLKPTEEEKPSEEIKSDGGDEILQQKIKSLEQENSALQIAMSSDKDVSEKNLEQKNTELQSDISQYQNLTATNQQLEEQIQSCINGRADLEKENTELQTVKSENQVLIAENMKLKETIESHVNEIDVLKSRLTEIRSMTKVQEASEVQSSEAKPEAAP
jgi:chromosome segregation ATPase